MADTAVPPILQPQRKNLQNDPLSTRARRVDDSKYYVAMLYQPSSGLSFRAFVPETFALTIQNHWEPIFGGAEGVANTAAGKFFQGVGTPVSLKYLTRRIWVGTEPLEFNFTFLLDAYSSTYGDVEQPIENIIKMATPTRLGAFLFAPGPNMLSDEKRIYMKIGKFMILESVIIHNIDITFYSIADKTDGRYMSADLSVHISTNYTPDQQDIINIFKKGQSGDTSLDPSNAAPGVGKNIQDALNQLEKEGVGAIKNTFNNILPGNLLFNQ